MICIDPSITVHFRSCSNNPNITLESQRKLLYSVLSSRQVCVSLRHTYLISSNVWLDLTPSTFVSWWNMDGLENSMLAIIPTPKFIHDASQFNSEIPDKHWTSTCQSFWASHTNLNLTVNCTVNKDKCAMCVNVHTHTYVSKFVEFKITFYKKKKYKCVILIEYI